MSDFDTLKFVKAEKDEARDMLIDTLTVHVLRMRQLCKLATETDASYPTLMAEIIALATPGQEAKLRAYWNLMQTFANADPQTQPVPDLPSS